MPVTESAKKALRNALAKEARNSEIKLNLKRLLKNATTENIGSVVSFVDKAAKRHIIHPNKAARIKSRLSKLGTEPTKPVVKRAKKSPKKTTSKKK